MQGGTTSHGTLAGRQKRHQHGHHREPSLPLPVRKFNAVSAYEVVGRHNIVPSTQTPPPGTFSLKAYALSWLTVIVLWAVALVILRRMKKVLTLSTAATSRA